jgi:pyruvate dehydrogenase (quinone)
LDSQPVLAILGQQVTSVLGSGYQQEIDLARLYGDVCAQFAQTPYTADQLRMLLDRAVRTALATRSPTCVVLPHDVNTAPAPDLGAYQHRAMLTNPGCRCPSWAPPRRRLVPQRHLAPALAWRRHEDGHA